MSTTAPTNPAVAGPITGLRALLTFEGIEKAAAYQGAVSVMPAKIDPFTGMVTSHVTAKSATGYMWQHDNGDTDGVLYQHSSDAQAAAILFGATR